MKTRIIIFLFALGLMQMSCDEYLDVNDSPNNPTSENVPPNLVLTGAQTQVYRLQARRMNRLGNAFMNTWGPNINSFTGGFAEEFSLAISNTFYSDVWSGIYLNTFAYQTIINSEGTTFNNHKAIAKIMKSFYMQYIVDLYGDAPYSQAHQRGENLTPAYDDDAEIYKALLAQVDEAIVMLQDNVGNAVGDEDVIFGGDNAAWIRFANTLKLRLLVRAASATELTAEVAAGFASLSGADFVAADVTINPGYSNGEGAQQNPFYNLYGFDTDGNATTSRNFIRASEHAVEFLSGASNGAADPRLSRIYAQNANGNFVGIEQGAQDNGSVDLSPLGTGLVIDSAQDGYIMLASESFFLQAEAMLNGNLPGGDAGAQAMFEAGIAASFNHLGAGSATGYTTSANGVVGLGWTGSNANKLEAIMTQKWVSHNGTNAIESWIEYTRTGYPVVPLPTSAQFSDKPNRLMYPNSEYIGNSANVPSQTQADAFSTKIFWDNN